MHDSADPTRFFGGGAMSLTLDAQGTAATVSDPGGIEHPHRAIVFGASGLPQRALPLADNAVCRQIELALPGCLFALHAPTAGDQEGWQQLLFFCNYLILSTVWQDRNLRVLENPNCCGLE